MPIIGVKRANSELHDQTPVKKSSLAPGLWSRLTGFISRLIPYDYHSSQSGATIIQPVVKSNAGSSTPMRKQNNETFVTPPLTRTLYTPVLSELERSEKCDVTTPTTIRHSRSLLFTPLLLSNSSKHHHHHHNLLSTTPSPSMTDKKQQLSSTTMLPPRSSTGRPSKISRHILTPSKFESRDQSVLTVTPMSVDQLGYQSISTYQSRSADHSRYPSNQSRSADHSRYQSNQSRSADQSRYQSNQSRSADHSRYQSSQSRSARYQSNQSRSADQSRCQLNQSGSADQSRYQSNQSRSADQSRSSSHQSGSINQLALTDYSNDHLFSVFHTSPVLTPTINHMDNGSGHISDITPEHNMPHNVSQSPIGELQQWINKFKDSYQSKRRDVTAQIDAAEKLVRLQSDQRNQLCDQRMEQLRKRFDSGLDISELLADDKQAMDEQPEMRLQHDKTEQLLIQKAFGAGPGDEELSCAYRIRLKRRDFQTLCGLHWLNDEVVNFYMSMIADSCSDVHSYSSFFYPKLIGSAGYNGVRRWTKKVDVFSKRLLLIPVHLGMHWCLATINFTSKQISYYDSLKGHNPECLRALKQYLVQEAEDKKQMVYDMSEWQCTTHKNIPGQQNGSDCGVFMCMYARHLARSRPFNFSQDDMPIIREHMVLEMLEKKLI